MQEDINQKLIDEIIALTKISNHKLREKTLQLIEIYYKQKKKQEREKQKNNRVLQLIDKRNTAVNKASMTKDKLLGQQAKMASMGEMMDAVAHQWKQPLNSISMMNSMLLEDFRDAIIDEEYIVDMTETVDSQIEHMVSTLNEFRTFFRPSKDTKDFSIKNCISSVQVLMKDELIKNNITIHLEIKDDVVIHGLINEFKHLFLNLISNSIDAFNERNIKTRDIYISTSINEYITTIKFEDNAQGIPEHLLVDILKPNVTTKEEGKGTGIGLYMSSQIVQKHQGSIQIENSDTGAVFSIIFRK